MSIKKKKLLTVALSVLLVAAIAVGATLAYLSTRTNIETNTFTFAENVRALLTEPNWDPDDARDLVPGMEIAKDPQITNTSNNGVDEYAAIKLVFVDGANKPLNEADMTKLMGLISINWSSATWTIADPATSNKTEQIWIYEGKLLPAYTTTPLFDKVTILDTVTPDELEWLAGIFDHKPACYEFGACACTPDKIHHKNCDLFKNPANTADAIKGVAKGGALGGRTCDCTEVGLRHKDGCPAWIGSLKADCGCTMTGGLGGFSIVVQGGVVQADAFEDLPAPNAAAKQALVGVFATTPPTPPAP